MPHALTEVLGQHFQPLVGQELRFLRPNSLREAVDLTLLDVRVSQWQGMQGRRRQFSLLLSLRDASPLDDKRMHALVHQEFEPCELLLSRVMAPELDRHDGTMYYEMVFG